MGLTLGDGNALDEAKNGSGGVSEGQVVFAVGSGQRQLFAVSCHRASHEKLPLWNPAHPPHHPRDDFKLALLAGFPVAGGERLAGAEVDEGAVDDFR
jgi:hypothetical protein